MWIVDKYDHSEMSVIFHLYIVNLYNLGFEHVIVSQHDREKLLGPIFTAHTVHWLHKLVVGAVYDHGAHAAVQHIPTSSQYHAIFVASLFIELGHWVVI
jgi:hypothetical protein